jgi:hypothetical protein
MKRSNGTPELVVKAEISDSEGKAAMALRQTQGEWTRLIPSKVGKVGKSGKPGKIAQTTWTVERTAEPYELRFAATAPVAGGSLKIAVTEEFGRANEWPLRLERLAGA